MAKNGNIWDFGDRIIKKNKIILTQEVANTKERY